MKFLVERGRESQVSDGLLFGQNIVIVAGDCLREGRKRKEVGVKNTFGGIGFERLCGQLKPKCKCV